MLCAKCGGLSETGDVVSDKKDKKRNVKNVMCDVYFGECKVTKITQLMGWGCGVCLFLVWCPWWSVQLHFFMEKRSFAVWIILLIYRLYVI